MQFIHTKVFEGQDAQDRPISAWSFYARKTDGVRGFVVALGPYRFALIAS